MERLSIDEVIEHCNKTCDMTEKIAKARGHELESIESKQFWEHYQVREWLKELKAYRDAEEQGLLLRLPCKVGDTVWDVDWSLTECIVKEFGFDEAGEVYCHYDSKDGIFSAKAYLEAFGSGLFLTKEEAEQKLAEMKGV